MHVYIDLFGFHIASYGTLIVCGGLISNFIAYIILHRKKMDFNDFILLESFGFLGAILGAKILYLIVSFKEIDWVRITEMSYLQQVMMGGFVFYGGFIGGILMALIAAKKYDIDFYKYANEIFFLIPFAHAFGRLGCFMAGCCYGVPYNGRFAVVFPVNSFAIHGIKLFPVQLVEAFSLVIIAIIIYLVKNFLHKNYSIELYFILYGTMRLILEKYRYDDYRGEFLGISTSQWISIALILIGIKLLGKKEYERKIDI